jgi:hypothetical protein
MKRMLLALVLSVCLLAAPAVISAQDAPCDIDLQDVAALVVRAQAEASAGDTSAALATLDGIQDAIDAIESACDGTGVAAATPAPEPTAPPLTADGLATFVSADGVLRFNYPPDWLIYDSGAANWAEATIIMGDTFFVSGALVPGLNYQGVQLYIGDAAWVSLQSDMADDATLEDIVAALRETYETSEDYEVIASEAVELGGWAVVRLDVLGIDTGLDVTIYVLEVASETFAQVVGIVETGQRADFAPTLNALVASLRVNLPGD